MYHDNFNIEWVLPLVAVLDHDLEVRSHGFPQRCLQRQVFHRLGAQCSPSSAQSEVRNLTSPGMKRGHSIFTSSGIMIG
jgi:hypothetical protein